MNRAREMRFVEHASAVEFLRVAGGFLQAQESQNSLSLGIAIRTAEGVHSADKGTRFFSVSAEGTVRGAVTQTPGHACVFTEMPHEVACHVARRLSECVSLLVGCHGPQATVEAVLSTWSEMQLGPLAKHAALRLFELTKLNPPNAVPGHLRLAQKQDFELCRRWQQRFAIDCRMPDADPDRLPERVHSLDQQRLYLWELDNVPVACAAWARPVNTGVTIGFVYTPDEQRGRGFASNAVANLTRGLLDGRLYQPARQRVTLFTDIENPVSNSIYQKMGYRAIGDHGLYMFS